MANRGRNMTRRSLIVALVVLLGRAVPAFPVDATAAHPDAGSGRFPGYPAIAAGPWQLRLLPGRQEFTFTMYGCPGNVDELKQLVGVMREKGSGQRILNPGPDGPCLLPSAVRVPGHGRLADHLLPRLVRHAGQARAGPPPR